MEYIGFTVDPVSGLESGEICMGFWCQVYATHASECQTVGLLLENESSN